MNLKIGILTLLLIVGGFVLLKKSAEPKIQHDLVRARLTDVRGMPVGAPVTLAGLKVGMIVERRVGAGYAEIDIQFDSLVSLRTDATLYKKRNSMLSGPSLEIDPGHAEEALEGKYIQRVVETSALGDILYDISNALPAMNVKAEAGQRKAEEFRAQINGPFRDALLKLDKEVEEVHSQMDSRLSGIDEALKRGGDLQFNARASIEPFFDRSEELSAFANEQLGLAQEWVSESAAKTRQAMEDSAFDLEPYATPVESLDEGKGRLGDLLNRPEAHGDWVEITGSARSFVRSISRWKMHVGFRTEFATRAGEGRVYVSVKAGRSHRYFYMEVMKSANGGAAEVSVVYDENAGTWRRELKIKNTPRLTAQWARRLGPAVFRYGLKESSFGLGTDIELIDNRLEISADVFDFGRSDRPNLRVAASYRIFSQLYILAGLDDVLNPAQVYSVEPLGTENPKQLEDIYLGRDLYFGASLRFDDRDLASLMRIGGAALTALAPI